MTRGHLNYTTNSTTLTDVTLGAILVAARLDRITRRAHTLSGLLEEGLSLRAGDMPGADDLLMRIYAAMPQKERAQPVHGGPSSVPSEQPPCHATDQRQHNQRFHG